GLGFGFIGILLISIGSGDGLGFSPGVVLILMAAIATSLFFVFQKPLFEKYSAIELTAYFTWIGTIPFLYFVPGLLNDIQTASLEANLTAIFIGIFPTSIAYLTWSIALSLASASSISSILYIEPVIAIIVAWIWINDLPSTLSTLGGVIAISGVLIVNYFGKKQRLLQSPQIEPSTK
ncbi:EamA family transporter, partial [Butyricicoccus sp. 1XD8-22]